MNEIRICRICKKQFEVKYKSSKQKYCSPECYHKSPTKGKPPQKERKKCIVCGKPIPLSNKKFCSSKCNGIYIKGKLRETTKQIKKICPICNTEFLVGGITGKPRNQIYCSLKCAKKSLKGNQYEKIEQYSKYKDCILWKKLRKEIIEERGAKCELCGETEKQLNLHHIVPVTREINHNKDNLLLVCIRCHSALERLTEVGYNNNKDFNPHEIINILKTK